MALPKESDFDNLLRNFAAASRLIAGVDGSGGLVYQGLDPANAGRGSSAGPINRVVRGLIPRPSNRLRAYRARRLRHEDSRHDRESSDRLSTTLQKRARRIRESHVRCPNGDPSR